MKKILIIPLILSYILCNSQNIVIDKSFISKYDINSIHLKNIPPIKDNSEYDGYLAYDTYLCYDSIGLLTDETTYSMDDNDTLSKLKTLYIYCNHKSFLSVTKEFICNNDSYRINSLTEDSTCLPNIQFSLYTYIQNDSVITKTYLTDDILDYYFNRFYDKSTLENGWELYQRDMEWLKNNQYIHHINPETKNTIIDEIFIYYSFYSEESMTWIDEQTGDTIVEHQRDSYMFDSTNTISVEVDSRFIESEITLNKYNEQFFTFHKSKKRIKNLRKIDSFSIDLNTFFLQVNLKTNK